MEVSCVKKDKNYLLKIAVEQNTVGIVYKVAAVLYKYEWNILEAVIETLPGSLIKDIFIIKGKNNQEMKMETLENIKNDFSNLLFSDSSLADYINELNLDQSSKNSKHESSVINLFNPPTIDSTVLDIQAKKSSEKLLLITGILYISNIDIVSLIVKTDLDFERYSFLLKKGNGEKLSTDVIEGLKERLIEVV